MNNMTFKAIIEKTSSDTEKIKINSEFNEHARYFSEQLSLNRTINGYTSIQLINQNNPNDIIDVKLLVSKLCHRIEYEMPKNVSIAHYKCLIANLCSLTWSEDFISDFLSRFTNKINFDNIGHMTETILSDYLHLVDASEIEEVLNMKVEMYEFSDIDWYNELFKRIFQKPCHYDVTYDDVDYAIDGSVVDSEIAALKRVRPNDVSVEYELYDLTIANILDEFGYSVYGLTNHEFDDIEDINVSQCEIES